MKLVLDKISLVLVLKMENPELNVLADEAMGINDIAVISGSTRENWRDADIMRYQRMHGHGCFLQYSFPCFYFQFKEEPQRSHELHWPYGEKPPICI